MPGTLYLEFLGLAVAADEDGLHLGDLFRSNRPIKSIQAESQPRRRKKRKGCVENRDSGARAEQRQN